AQLVDHQRAAVGNRYAATDAGRAQVLPPLEHLVQDALALVVEGEQADELFQDLILRLPLDVEGDGFSIEKFTQFHLCLQVPDAAVCGSGGGNIKVVCIGVKTAGSD